MIDSATATGGNVITAPATLAGDPMTTSDQARRQHMTDGVSVPRDLSTAEGREAHFSDPGNLPWCHSIGGGKARESSDKGS
jgi:hypothetical protein